MEEYFDKASTSKQKETAQQKPKRKYKEDHAQYEFIASGPEDNQQPFCIICNKAFYLMSRLFPASLADMWRKIIQHCRINQKNIL